jgi:superfamily II DNA or RNA helicase
LSRIVDNQKNIQDGLNHVNMVDIFKEYHDDSEDFKFHVGSGFFFLDGFGELYDFIEIDKLKLGSDSYENDWGTRAPILVMMGKETNQTTKEALIDAENMVKYALNTHEEQYMEFLEDLIKKDLIKFKVFTEQRFHAKIYFFYDGRSLEDVYVGSANLTSAGLTRNIELTAPMNTTKSLKKVHRVWFNSLWNRATDDLNVLDIIKTYKTHDFIYYEPIKFFENLIKLMDKEYLFYNSDISDNTLLVKFQSFDFYQVMSTLEKYNGCILASSVGLGKSYVALEVMRYVENNDMDALLVGPSNLVKGKESVWNEYLQKYDLDVETVGYGDLQQSNFDSSEYKNYDLVVIDEAHNLRNASNRRKHMMELIKNSPNAKYLLLTATPINVKISDLNSLIDLFYEVNKHRWLDKELKTRYELFKTKVNKLEKSSDDYDEILKEVLELQEYVEKELIVKSTRSMIREYFSEDLKRLAGTDEIPEPEVFSEIYDYPEEYHEKFFNILPGFLLNLSYEHAKFYRDEEGLKYFENKNLMPIYKWVLYKRAESSIYGFYASIKKLKERLEIYISYLENSMLEEETNLPITSEFKERLDIAKSIYNSFESDEEKRLVIQNMSEDIRKISEMINELEKFKTNMTFKDDSKIEQLKSILQKNKDKKCLIFTEYFDTLYYLFKNLKNEFSIDYVAGKNFKGQSMSHTTKETKIRKFRNDVFQHMVSTDVLAEGFNIPEADIVINYDLPYNPVKMIQRVGRATRINVPNQIEIRNFNPDESIDQELNLIEKLDIRIENIISMIGIDYSIWADTEQMVKDREKRDSINKCKVLKELKNRIATENPEDIYQIRLRDESKLDLLLKKSVEHYNLKQEDIPIKKPSKPIYTTLIGPENGFYGIYQFGNDHYEYGDPVEFIQEPIKTIKSYSTADISSFCEIMKSKYREIEYRKEDQAMNNVKDKNTVKKVKLISKKIPSLKKLLNELLATKIYTNHKITALIDEIYTKSSQKGFIFFKEKEQIKSWINAIETITEEEGLEEIKIMERWADDPLSYKKDIKAFIQYYEADLDV